MPKKKKKTVKNRIKKKESKEDIGKYVLQTISDLSKKINKNPVDELSLSFYEVFRGFFAKFFRIRFKFTYDELIEEIESKRIDPRHKRRIEKLAKKLTYLEYSNINITNKVFREMVNDFKYLVKKLAFPEKDKKVVTRKLDIILSKISKKSRLFKKQKIKKVKKPAKLKAKEKAKKKIPLPEPIASDKEIYSLLEKAYISIVNKNFDEAKEIYIKIVDIYDKLPKDKRGKVHDDILNVFKPKTKEKIKPKNEIDKLIIKTYYHMGKRDVMGAGKFYNLLEKEYKNLSEEEKEKYYPKLSELYENIKIIFC